MKRLAFLTAALFVLAAPASAQQIVTKYSGIQPVELRGKVFR